MTLSLKTFVPRSADREVQRAFQLLRDDLKAIHTALGSAGVPASLQTTIVQQVAAAATSGVQNVFVQAADPGPFTYPILWIKLIGTPITDFSVIIRTP